METTWTYNQVEYTLYIAVRAGHYYLRKDGKTANGVPWRWLKLPEGYALHEGPDYPTVVHVRDIVAATRQRLGVE